jgi:histidinol-phosphate aminotransferase
MPNRSVNLARPEIFNLKPYIPGKPIEEVKRELGLTDVIKMASNENPLGASPLAEKAVREAINLLHIYPDSNCYYLRQKLAEKYGVAENMILLGNGSDEILRLIAETFLRPGDEVVLARPTFVEYEFTALVMGAQCVAIPLKEDRHDLPAMLEAINGATRIVYLCNPNNPTGTYVNKSELDRWVASLPDDVILVIDEAYGEYATKEDYPDGLSYVREGRNVIVLKTFSKIYGLAALRIGYGLCRAELAALVQRVSEPFNVNLLAQVAATAALDDNEHVQRSRDNNAEGMQYLTRALDELGLPWIPSQANFLLIDTGRDCRSVFEKLLSKGVIVRTGDVYGYPRHIRVTVGRPQDNARLVRELIGILKEPV